MLPKTVSWIEALTKTAAHERRSMDNMCITMDVNCLTVAVTVSVAVAVAVAVTETESIGTTAMVQEGCLQSVSPSAGFTTCAC